MEQLTQQLSDINAKLDDIQRTLRSMKSAAVAAAAAAPDAANMGRPEAVSCTGVVLNDGNAYKSGAGAFYRVKLDNKLTVGGFPPTEYASVGIRFDKARLSKLDRVCFTGVPRAEMKNGRTQITVFVDSAEVVQAIADNGNGTAPEDDMDVPY